MANVRKLHPHIQIRAWLFITLVTALVTFAGTASAQSSTTANAALCSLYTVYSATRTIIYVLALALMLLGAATYASAHILPQSHKGSIQAYGMGMILGAAAGLILASLALFILNIISGGAATPNITAVAQQCPPNFFGAIMPQSSYPSGGNGGNGGNGSPGYGSGPGSSSGSLPWYSSNYSSSTSTSTTINQIVSPFPTIVPSTSTTSTSTIKQQFLHSTTTSLLTTTVMYSLVYCYTNIGGAITPAGYPVYYCPDNAALQRYVTTTRVVNNASQSLTLCATLAGYACQGMRMDRQGRISFTFEQNATAVMHNAELACAANATANGQPYTTNAYYGMTLGYTPTAQIQYNGTVTGNSIWAGQVIAMRSWPCYTSIGALPVHNLTAGTMFRGYVWLNFTEGGSPPSDSNPWVSSRIYKFSVTVS